MKDKHTIALAEARLAACTAVVCRGSTVPILRAAQGGASAASLARTAGIVRTRNWSRSQAVACAVCRLATSTAVVLGAVTVTIL